MRARNTFGRLTDNPHWISSDDISTIQFARPVARNDRARDSVNEAKRRLAQEPIRVGLVDFRRVCDQMGILDRQSDTIKAPKM
jgi:hypothetical protein